jgi:hypothetical protein
MKRRLSFKETTRRLSFRKRNPAELPVAAGCKLFRSFRRFDGVDRQLLEVPDLDVDPLVGVFSDRPGLVLTGNVYVPFPLLRNAAQVDPWCVEFIEDALDGLRLNMALRIGEQRAVVPGEAAGTMDLGVEPPDILQPEESESCLTATLIVGAPRFIGSTLALQHDCDHWFAFVTRSNQTPEIDDFAYPIGI